MATNESIKIVIIGDTGVGKTSLMYYFKLGGYPTEFPPSVFDYSDMPYYFDNEEIALTLFDTAGDDAYRVLRPLSYADADCFLMCYSVISPTSAQNLREKWFPELSEEGFGAVPVVLCGTKYDLIDTNANVYVSPDDVTEIVERNETIVEVSTFHEEQKTGEYEGQISIAIDTCIELGRVYQALRKHAQAQKKSSRETCLIL